MSCNVNRFACVRGTCELQNSSVEPIVENFVCLCDIGWVGDQTFFHLNGNCGIPEEFLLGLFITFGIVVGLPVLAYSIYLTKHATKNLKRMGIGLSVTILLTCLSALVLYLEDGMFEVMSIFLCVNSAALNFVDMSIFKMTTSPVLAVTRSKVEQWRANQICRVFVITRCYFLIYGCVLSAYSRTPTFNFLIVAYLSGNVAIILLTSLLQLWYVNRLMGMIAESMNANGRIKTDSNDKNLLVLIDHLRKLRNSLIAFAIHGPAFGMGIVALFFCFEQQLPYVWTLWPTTCIVQFYRYFSCLLLMKRSGGTTAKAQASISTQQPPVQ
jgi:hypothetical protein